MGNITEKEKDLFFFNYPSIRLHEHQILKQTIYAALTLLIKKNNQKERVESKHSATLITHLYL